MMKEFKQNKINVCSVSDYFEESGCVRQQLEKWEQKVSKGRGNMNRLHCLNNID